MSDTNDMPASPALPAAAEGSQFAGLSGERLAAARANWVRLGLDPAKFDAALNPLDVGAMLPPGQQATPGQPSASRPLMSQAAADLTAAQLAAGGADGASVEAHMAEAGYVPDDRTDEERAHDAEWGFDRHYEPQEYGFAFHETPLAKTMTSEQLVAAQATWGNLLAGMQINPTIGGHLVEHAINLGHRLARMSDAERSLWRAEARMQNVRSAGGEAQLAERVRLRDLALSVGMKGNAEAIKALIDTGLIADPYVTATLANHGRAIEQWSRGPKKAA